jgi:lipopolysaccharide export system permease protein
MLKEISREIVDYSHSHNLRKAPNIIKIFFRYHPDHKIENIDEQIEKVIDDLSNTKDKVVMHELNNYPILAVKAHTRPFEHRWMNTMAAIIVPVGMFFYIRMWIFRLRLYNDLRTMKAADDAIIERIDDHILKNNK